MTTDQKSPRAEFSAARELRISLIEVFFSSFMVGAGEAFFAAFALSKGLGELLAGFVVGFPMMMGACLQTLTPVLFQNKAKAKSWVVWTAAGQALMLFCLMLTCFINSSDPWLIFVLIGLYWAFSFSSGSVWNFWMGHVFPEEGRSRYFASRMRLTQYGTMSGLLLTGFLLQKYSYVPGTPVEAKAYLVPFLIAGLARVGSTLSLALQSKGDLAGVKTQVSNVTAPIRQFFTETIQIFRGNQRARQDLTFLFLFNSTIFISSPFVAPFLLAKLRFDPMSFMATLLALYLGKVLSLSRAAGWIEKFGLRRVFFIGALGMSPLPALWMFVHHTMTAILLQVVSGFFWGLFEVSVSLVLFSEFPHKDKIQLLTWNSFFQTVAVLIGTLFGGFLLSQQMESHMGYVTIFIAAGVLRTALVLVQRPKIFMNSK